MLSGNYNKSKGLKKLIHDERDRERERERGGGRGRDVV
jgi:hypothetical protein